MQVESQTCALDDSAQDGCWHLRIRSAPLTLSLDCQLAFWHFSDANLLFDKSGV